MIKFPVTREYLGLMRYLYRHWWQSWRYPPVDRQWWDEERRAIALLLAQDNHPTEREYERLELQYSIITYFPFMNEDKNDAS